MLLSLIISILISLLREDKEKALKEIFKKFQVEIVNFIRIKVNGDIDLAYEIYQDSSLSFIKYIYEKNINFESDNKIKNLLLTIAMNKLKDHFRKNKKMLNKVAIFKSEEELNSCIDKLIYASETPIEILINTEEKNKLQDVIKLIMAKIPEKYKQVLIYKFIDEKGNKEISGVLNISIKAVESLVFRAKENFKKELLKTSLTKDILEDNK